MAPSKQLARLLHTLMGPLVRETPYSIVLPAGETWPDLHSPVLYVRPFYHDLWEKVLERGVGAPRRAIVMGTPGSE